MLREYHCGLYKASKKERSKWPRGEVNQIKLNDFRFGKEEEGKIIN